MPEYEDSDDYRHRLLEQQESASTPRDFSGVARQRFAWAQHIIVDHHIKRLHRASLETGIIIGGVLVGSTFFSIFWALLWFGGKMELSIIVGLAAISANFSTMALMAYTLWRMIQLTAESRAARIAAVSATLRAEAAAVDAAAHAQDAKQAIAKVATTIAEVKEQTNGMSHRLEALAGEAGEGRGRQQAAEEAKEVREAEESKRP